jgi:predicted PurR-regulated permease PerM
MERNPWLRALLILGSAYLGVQLFLIAWRFGRFFAQTLLIFFLAWMLSFILNPPATYLQRRFNLARPLAVTLAYLGALACLVAIGFLVVPPAVGQVQTLGSAIPGYRQDTGKLISDAQSWLNHRHLHVDLSGINTSDLNKQIDNLGTTLTQQGLALAPKVLAGVFDAVIVIVVSFYMLLDAPRITNALVNVTPERYRRDVRFLFASIDHSFGGYIRTSVVLAVIYAAGTALAMAVTGIPFVLPVSIFAGLMLIIPFIGDIIAVIPTVLIGLVTVSLVDTVIALVLMIALQQLVLQVLRPKLMGRSVGLHPLWVLAAFFAGAQAAGFWGALFSVPVVAILQSVVQVYYYRITGRPQPAAIAALEREATEQEPGAQPAAPFPFLPPTPRPLPDDAAKGAAHEAEDTPAGSRR